MDGLLLDTEPIIMASIEKAGRELGWEIDEHVQISTIGRPDHDSKEIFVGYYGKDFPYEEINKRRFDYVEEVVKTSGVPIKLGAEKILNSARDLGLILGIATSTPMRRARFLLEEAKLWDYFHTRVFGDQVAKGKPDPDIFLAAAENLRVSPRECLVFEDSESGILAASAADMWPILVPDSIKHRKEVIDLAYNQYPDLLAAADDLKSLIGNSDQNNLLSGP